MRCAATGLTTGVFCWQRPGWMLRVTACVWRHCVGMSFGAVSHLRCAVSGFTPAVCHGFGAVSHQAVCRDEVADRHVLWSGFTPAVCR
eukprot:COSAG06_NODE_5554_length_3404_cov_571.103480_3_plen_88_part_00